MQHSTLSPVTAPSYPVLCRFLFVGERPSRRALRIGATWQNGKLAGKTLRQALLTLGLDPDIHRYLNLYPNADPAPDDPTYETRALEEIAHCLADGYRVVGLGQIVCARLHAHDIPHLCLIHPPARGAIRQRERYQAHVAEQLLCAEREPL